jgi:hypothetical protein
MDTNGVDLAIAAVESTGHLLLLMMTSSISERYEQKN